MKVVSLGKVTKKHVSGMAETDKGYKFPAGVNVDKGNYLVEIDGKKMFVSADQYGELTESDKPKYQVGVTQKLRKQADSLSVEYFETTTKEELEEAIQDAEDELGSGGDA